MANTITKKKMTTMVLAGVLIFTIAIGATLAWYFDIAQEKENKFTFLGENGIAAEIIEPSWVEADAQNLLPNAVIPKDPQIKNISESDEKLWGALKITYQGLDGSTATDLDATAVGILLEIIEIDFETNGGGVKWEKESGVGANANGVRYYYRTALIEDEITTPLFTKVTIKDVDQDKIAELLPYAPDGFYIRVDGAVVQEFQTTYTEAQANLNSLLP